MPGDRWQQLANLRALYAYMWAHPGKQLLFMGSEFAQENEWSESRSLDWWHLGDPLHLGVQTLVRDLNQAYRVIQALWAADNTPHGFFWIDANDAENNVFSFVRRAGVGGGRGTTLVSVSNFAGIGHYGYRLGLPFPGRWQEILNTDASEYGGSGEGNLGAVVATEEDRHGQPASASLTLPPLTTIWFVYDGAAS
jgi:1,4-alpha-glucan branching enzyme